MGMESDQSESGISGSNGVSSELLSKKPWAWFRAKMPIANRWAYFDHAAVAPLPRDAVDAVNLFTKQASQDGDTAWPKWAAEAEKVRNLFADMVSADISEICLVPNTTTGINIVAEGFPWKPGDNVVIPEGEFPSNLFPWLNQQSKGVEVRIVPRRGQRVVVDDLLARADGATRIISASWVGFSSGYRLDIKELTEKAHARGLLVFLDAIQGLGMYPLDLSAVPVDFVAADGHKWLLGPEGAGMMAIRQCHIETLRCGNVGWNSVANSHLFLRGQFSPSDHCLPI